VFFVLSLLVHVFVANKTHQLMASVTVRFAAKVKPIYCYIRLDKCLDEHVLEILVQPVFL